MKKTIFVYANPNFDTRFKCGISRLYQVFTKQYGFKLEIVDEDFLRENEPHEETPDILVIAGGDGTIHRVLNLIPDHLFEKYIFGIMPGGTANEFAKSLGIPIIFEEAAKIIGNQRNIIRQKIGIVNKNNRFATGFLYGIASYVLQETPEKSKFYFGEYAYPLPGLLAISNYQDFIRKFQLDSLKFHTAYLLINNASLVGKNIPVNNINAENKNLFSVLYLHSRVTLGDLTRLMLKNRARQNILEDPAIFYKQMEKIQLKFDGKLKFMLDGEVYHHSSPIEFEHSNYEIRITV